jgi:hypothetical protein
MTPCSPENPLQGVMPTLCWSLVWFTLCDPEDGGDISSETSVSWTTRPNIAYDPTVQIYSLGFSCLFSVDLNLDAGSCLYSQIAAHSTQMEGHCWSLPPLFGPVVILQTGMWRYGTRAPQVLAGEPSGAGTHVLLHLPTRLYQLCFRPIYVNRFVSALYT